MSNQNKWAVGTGVLVIILAIIFNLIRPKPLVETIEPPDTVEQLDSKETWPKSGIANTQAQPGYDAGTINLWNKADSKETVRCQLKHGTMVSVVKAHGSYIYVQQENDTACAGWCLENWIDFTP